MFSTATKTKDARDVTIREATADDAARMLAYMETIASESDFLTFGPGELGMTFAEEQRFLESCSARDNSVYLIAEIDGEIEGVLSFLGGKRPRTRHWGEFGMSVRKRSWGLGLGRALVEALVAWARGTGIVTKIALRVRADNARAIALYESTGFANEGTITRGLRVDGRYHDLHVMGREL